MTNGFFQRLRDALLPAKQAPPAAASRQLFIHEDAYGDIEVLPASVADWCAQEISEIAIFSARHKAPDGTGWTDIYVRKPAPAGIASLAIPLAATVEALGRRFPRFDEVVIGTFSSPEPVRGVHAFGPSRFAAIVLSGDSEGQNLASIVLVLNARRADARAIFSALASVPSPEPLIVVDWPGAACFRLNHAPRRGTISSAA